MTEEVTPETEPRTAHFSEPDFLLQILASAADDSNETEFSVTLAVNGLLVSGQLIGRRRWFREVSEDPTLAAIAGVTEALNKTVVDQDEKDEELSPSDYHFVHLSDARYIDANGIIPTESKFFWRGQLSHVSGWSWGVFGP